MKKATIEVITGPMFSGKSSELIRRAKRFELAGYKVQCFKPSIDNRYDQTHIASHDKVLQKAEPVEDTNDLLGKLDPQTEIIAIDEIQFFDDSILALCERWAEEDKHIIISGLLLDCFGKPFAFMDSEKNMLHLIAIADTVQTLHAICTHKHYDGKICGEAATRTQRFVDGKVAPKGDVVVVGGKESYAPRCRKCYVRYD